MNLVARIARLEEAAGVANGGACPLCASRAAKSEAEGRREFGPEWERGEAYPTEFNCRRCGSPFTIIFQVIMPRAGLHPAA